MASCSVSKPMIDDTGPKTSSCAIRMRELTSVKMVGCTNMPPFKFPPATGGNLKGGMFVQPTIFTDVSSRMRIAQEEVFGPVSSIIGFDTEQEAIEIGNDVIYGLAAGVWTSDIGRAVRMWKALRSGLVWVNTYRSYSALVPIGGMKQS